MKYQTGISLLISAISVGLILSCVPKKLEKAPGPQIPYPGPAMALFLQAQIDSSEFGWFKDVKGAASAFCNEEVPPDSGAITTNDITILGESMFHAKVEARLPNKVLILTMERPFKEKGTNSIWQVIKMEEKKD